MAEKEAFTIICVYLLDEGTDVWRPVNALHVEENVYRIDPACTIPETELWQFGPGEMVRCEERRLSRGVCLVAIEKALDKGDEKS